MTNGLLNNAVDLLGVSAYELNLRGVCIDIIYSVGALGVSCTVDSGTVRNTCDYSGNKKVTEITLLHDPQLEEFNFYTDVYTNVLSQEKSEREKQLFSIEMGDWHKLFGALEKFDLGSEASSEVYSAFETALKKASKRHAKNSLF